MKLTSSIRKDPRVSPDLEVQIGHVVPTISLWRWWICHFNILQIRSTNFAASVLDVASRISLLVGLAASECSVKSTSWHRNFVQINKTSRIKHHCPPRIVLFDWLVVIDPPARLVARNEMMEFADFLISIQLWKAVQHKSVIDDTVIVFLSDNLGVGQAGYCGQNLPPRGR